MDEKTEFIQFITNMLEDVAEGRVAVRTLDKWRIYSECAKELEMVNGVMDLVGEDKELGTGYEIRLEVWK